MSTRVVKMPPGARARAFVELLAVLARLCGGRVTSHVRSPSQNASVGGSPVSKHLTGEALDLGEDSSSASRELLGHFGTIKHHVKGTAPHWHWELSAELRAILEKMDVATEFAVGKALGPGDYT